MIKTASFIQEFNGVKGTAFVLADFFTTWEVLNLKNSYLQPNGRPIRAVGTSAPGSYGEDDEVEGRANIINIRLVLQSKIFVFLSSFLSLQSTLIVIHYRIIDNAVPEELLVEEPLPDDTKYPNDMRDDVIQVGFRIDIDRRRQQPQQPAQPEL